MALLVTRFAMPVALIGTDAVFQRFMASDYHESQQVLQAVQGEASQLGTISLARQTSSKGFGIDSKAQQWMPSQSSITPRKLEAYGRESCRASHQADSDIRT